MMQVVATAGLLEPQVVQSCSQTITTNKPTSSFFTGRMPLLSPNQQCRSTEGKMSHSMDLLTPSSLGCLPTLYLTTNSSAPCLSSALWCQYPDVIDYCGLQMKLVLSWVHTSAKAADVTKSLLLNKCCVTYPPCRVFQYPHLSRNW